MCLTVSNGIKQTNSASFLFYASVCSTNYPPRKEMTPEQCPIYDSLLVKAGEETSLLGVGPDVVSGANFPSHSDVHFCCLTGQRIQVGGTHRHCLG